MCTLVIRGNFPKSWLIVCMVMSQSFCCVLKVAVCVAGKIGSKALQLSYKDKLRMVALIKQVASGPYHEDAMPAVGFFDVVGNDRK